MICDKQIKAFISLTPALSPEGRGIKNWIKKFVPSTLRGEG
jgi:hypothetical protein